MTDRSIQEIKALGRSLRSKLCPACGRSKRARQSFCPACYHRLTKVEQRALYDGFGEGYEEAFESALHALGVERPYFPEVQRS